MRMIRFGNGLQADGLARIRVATSSGTQGIFWTPVVIQKNV